jgi:hypothetical protein
MVEKYAALFLRRTMFLNRITGKECRGVGPGNTKGNGTANLADKILRYSDQKYTKISENGK